MVHNETPSVEGFNTAAFDLGEIRFKIADKRQAIHFEESARRAMRVGLFLLIPFLGLVTAVNLVRPAKVPLLWVDIATGLVSAGFLAYGIRYIMQKNSRVTELRTSISKLRDAERDAKFRMSNGGIRRLLWAYHSDTFSTIDEYRDQALKYRKVHNRFQTVIIIGSLTVTAVSTAAAQYRYLEWLSVFVSFFVGVSAGMTGYFKFRERSMNLQRAADDLEHECRAAELGISVYRSREEEDRLAEFAERAERIKEDQRNREQQLEQPPETQSTTGHAAKTS